MGREFELKYQGDPHKIEEIQKKYGSFSSIQMKTVYYDTITRDLSARRWMLRLRRENGISLCTLKTPLPDGSRGEWEVEADTIQAGIKKLCKLSVPSELAHLAKDGLEEVCGASFIRQAKTILLDGVTVELALDQGVLTGSGKALPFAEVEVELKEGSEAAATAFAVSLAQEFGLVPQPKSKQQRALELVE